jgi:thiol-disulfide isomerase/thioredoxin
MGRTKKNLMILAVLAAILFGGSLYKRYRIAPKMNTAQIPLTTLEGQVVSWSEFEGKTVFVNYWQTWCPPCRKEMPDLDKVNTELAKDNFVVIMVSDETPELLMKFKAKNPYSFNYYHTASLADLGVHTYPTSYVIRKDGTTAMSAIGERDWASNKMMAKFKTWAKE